MRNSSSRMEAFVLREDYFEIGGETQLLAKSLEFWEGVSSELTLLKTNYDNPSAIISQSLYELHHVRFSL